jgi:CRP-like cAMP-binding protein
VLFQRGTYGTSAFFVLSGAARVVLSAQEESRLERELQRDPVRRISLLRALSQLWTRPVWPEVRRGQTTRPSPREGEDAVFFLPDVREALARCETDQIGAGQFFGELSALGRTPRSATVFAETETELLELRWQGVRDLCRHGPKLQRHIDELYRANALKRQLAATPLLRHLSAQELERIAAETIFESYGNREWALSYRRLAGRDPAARLGEEPLVAREGD